jgi:NADPH:quinone reductase-like Zn-dependent oxidoreductase
MKALQIVNYGDLKDSLQISKIKKPILKANDVLIEVKATSLNPIDYKMLEGYPKDMISLNLPSKISLALGFAFQNIGQ